MAENNEKIASQILDAVGGADNIIAVENCITRLRFNLKDKSKANKEVLEGIEGVKGVVFMSGQCQVVMGNQATVIYRIYKRDGTISEQQDSTKAPAGKTKLFDRVMDVFAGSLSLIIPIVITSGLLQVLANLLVVTKIISSGSEPYNFLMYIGEAGFYFLPIFLGYSAAKKMNTNPAIGMLLGAVLLYPSLTSAIASEEGFRILGLTVPSVTYSSTVIPILLIVWGMTYVDKFVNRFMPKSMSNLFSPIVITLIMVPIALLVLGPLGVYIGQYVASFLTYLFNNNLGWLAVLLLAGLYPVLVMTGAHWAVLPISLEFFSTLGYDPLMSPSGLAYNTACAGVALAVAIKSKNGKLKALGYSAMLSALLGISEPSLYAIVIRMKKTMIGLFSGAIIGGLLGGLLNLRATAFMLQGPLAIPIYDGENGPLLATLVLVVSFVVSLAVTYVLGFEDIKEE